MGSTDVSERVEAVRRFNRFYTRKIGVLQEKLLLSPFSLTEARLIYELAHSAGSTATELRGRLGLDAGYLSRILRKLRKSGLISSQASKTDGRRSHLRMTEQGLAAFSRLNAASQEEIAAMLAALVGGGAEAPDRGDAHCRAPDRRAARAQGAVRHPSPSAR